MIRWKLIGETAAKVLSEAKVHAPPVKLSGLLLQQGVSLTSAPAEDHLSGFVLKKSGSKPVIGFNSELPPVRQRFVIAHELGHLLLHNKNGLHVDRSPAKHDGGVNADGLDEDEVEANRFAAEILMPEPWIREEVKMIGHPAVDDDPLIGLLAKKYMVSLQAMTIRLTSLGLIQM